MKMPRKDKTIRMISRIESNSFKMKSKKSVITAPKYGLTSKSVCYAKRLSLHSSTLNKNNRVLFLALTYEIDQRVIL